MQIITLKRDAGFKVYLGKVLYEGKGNNRRMVEWGRRERAWGLSRERNIELLGETRSKYPPWPDSASVDWFSYLYLFQVHSICTASPFGKILKSFPSRRNFAGCNFAVNRSCGILNIGPCQWGWRPKMKAAFCKVLHSGWAASDADKSMWSAGGWGGEEGSWGRDSILTSIQRGRGRACGGAVKCSKKWILGLGIYFELFIHRASWETWKQSH